MYDVLVGVILTKMFIEEDNIICNNSVSPTGRTLRRNSRLQKPNGLTVRRKYVRRMSLRWKLLELREKDAMKFDSPREKITCCHCPRVDPAFIQNTQHTLIIIIPHITSFPFSQALLSS